MAAMNVVILPGFLGSNLSKVPTQNQTQGNIVKYWYSLPALARGSIRNLQLAADGRSPLVPNWGPIRPTGLSSNGFDALVNTLSPSANVFICSYDWRLSFSDNAAFCLTQITSAFPSPPFYVIAHSMGGLVMRFIWEIMGVAGIQSRVKRILTLGTPHWGAYSAVELLTKISVNYLLITAASAPANVNLQTVYQAAVTQNPFGFVDSVVASWPSVTSLFPNPAQTNGQPDPNRGRIFQVANYQGINNVVTQSMLDGAKGWCTTLASAPYIPPDSIMVCVRGRGYDTDSTVGGALAPLNKGTSFGTDDGDDYVTAASAMLGTSAWDVYTSHQLLPSDPTFLANVLALLTNGIPANTVIDNPGPYFVPGPSSSLKGQVIIPPSPPVPAVPNVRNVPPTIIPSVQQPPVTAPPWCPVAVPALPAFQGLGGLLGGGGSSPPPPSPPPPPPPSFVLAPAATPSPRTFHP